MRRSVKILLVLSAFLVVLVGGAILFALPHWWIRIGVVEAKGPGETHSEASVFKSISGDVLFLVPEEESRMDCYVFKNATNEITIPSCPSQVHSFGIIAFSNEAPIPGVLSSDRIKVETDMNVVINDQEMAFTTLSGRRIHMKR